MSSLVQIKEVRQSDVGGIKRKQATRESWSKVSIHFFYIRWDYRLSVRKVTQKESK